MDEIIIEKLLYTALVIVQWNEFTINMSRRKKRSAIRQPAYNNQKITVVSTIDVSNTFFSSVSYFQKIFPTYDSLFR